MLSHSCGVYYPGKNLLNTFETIFGIAPRLNVFKHLPKYFTSPFLLENRFKLILW